MDKDLGTVEIGTTRHPLPLRERRLSEKTNKRVKK